MTDLVESLSSALDTREATVRQWDSRYLGDSPFVLLTPVQRDQLGERLKSLRIPLEALAVDLLNERLRLASFKVGGSDDLDLWERWNEMGGPETAEQVQRDALVSGTGYCTIWADETGQPVALPESARQCILRRDPVTRRVTVAFKRWFEDNRARGVLYLPDEIRILESASYVPDGGTIPANGWRTVSTIPNPLGWVPVVGITNLGAVTEPFGRSELGGLVDLADAVRKVMLDSLISSHETGSPRRWSTGVKLEENETGEVLDPWAKGSQTAMAEAADAKFGQFSPSNLAGFDTLVGMLLRQFGAASGLTPSMLGLGSNDAISADAIRASESNLIARAEARQRAFGRGWAVVGALLVAIRDGAEPNRIKVSATWRDPATRSEAQAADAAVKLHAEGLLSREGTLERLGMTPSEIAADSRRVAAEAAQRAVLAPPVVQTPPGEAAA
ncbi:MAG: phage portal protein [Marmoricola sp.]|nr:phage portal protein [Marmoricola sp.]